MKIGSVVHKNFYFNEMDLVWDLHGVTPRLDNVSGEARVGFGPGRQGFGVESARYPV